MKWIAHVYLANFYSSVQLGLKPELAQGPLTILKHNRVLDVNPPAADLGVKLRGTRRHAYQLCPDGVYLEYAEEEYRSATTGALAVCLNYTPVIEPAAENEFYLELAGPHSPEQVVQELALHLVPHCCSALSVGIGMNKLLAKLVNMALTAGRVEPREVASGGTGLVKYYWLNCTGQQEIDDFLRDLPVFYLWPLDNNSKQRLSHLGFTRIGEVARLDIALLGREFGRQAGCIQEWARGRDLSPVLALYPPQHICREVTFPGGLADSTRLEQTLKDLGERLAEELENQGCRKLSLELELEEGTRRGARSFSSPQNRAATFREVLSGILRRMELSGPVDTLRVTAEDLRPVYGVQLSLFADPKALAGRAKQQKNTLNALLENLGKKFAPQHFSLGKQEQPSRREQMLKFWDPLRFKER